MLDYVLPRKINTGLAMESDLPGFVAEFEERETAVFVHVSWLEWQQLTSDERAAAIAHYRLHILMDVHANQAVEEMQAKAQRAAQARVPNSRPSKRR